MGGGCIESSYFVGPIIIMSDDEFFDDDEFVDDDESCEDYDPYAAYLNEKYIQDRRITHAAERISQFLKLSETEIEEVLRIAFPIISRTKTIIYYDCTGNREVKHQHEKRVCGILCIKIIKALSELHARDRENIVKLIKPFYKKKEILPDSTLPHIIRALSDIPDKRERKHILRLSFPFYKLCGDDEHLGYAKEYPSNIIKAISMIPKENRENIMSQIIPRIVNTLDIYTQNCSFRTYSDGGSNGKRKDQHAKMIEIAAASSLEDLRSLLDHTFNDQYIPINLRTYKDQKSRNQTFERSYADLDDIVLAKMKVIQAIPACERSDLLEKSRLLVNKEMRDDEPIEILETLSKYPRSQRECAIVDALTRKNRGEDFIPRLIALSNIPTDQRDDVWEHFTALNKIINEHCSYTISKIIGTIGNIPCNQRKNIVNLSLRYFTPSSIKSFSEFPALLEMMANVPEDDRSNILANLNVFLKKRVLNSSDCAQIIQALSKI